MTTQTEFIHDVRETVVLDRREFSRLPPEFELVFVRAKSGESIAAKVENVSPGGIGLQLETNVGINADDAVDIIYLYAAIPAVVRHIESREDGTIVAGLEWSSRPTT